MMLAGKNITLLIGGSIAAYKSAELVRELVRRGAYVHVAMSRAAVEFITPLTMQTLSGNPVTTDLFDPARESEIGHIWLADHADLVVAAPATADLIARAAAGRADDVLTAVLLATRSPVVFAPAMNVNMWTNALTQRNVRVLREHGVMFVEPASGELACGWIGQGRLPELEVLVHALEYAVVPKDLMGSHVIVSAGPTLEPIDPVHFFSNQSNGRMGYSVAQVAQLRGAHVSLVTGPTELPPPIGVDVYRVTTAREMRDRIFELAERVEPSVVEGSRATQFVFMVAAVTDHQPASASAVKLKYDKSRGYQLQLAPAPDILRELRERRRQIEESSKTILKLIGFSADSGNEEDLLAWAGAKLDKKDIDLMVGNRDHGAFEHETTRVWLLDRVGRQEEIATADKELVAAKIIDAAMRV